MDKRLKSLLEELIIQFASVVNSIYGTYLDATTGFETVRQKIEKAHLDAFGEVKKDARLDYGKGAPDDPNRVIQHTCTVGEYLFSNNK
jgi:hypothetical protein